MLKCFVVVLLVFALSTQAHAEETEQIVDSFNAVVAKYDKFFKSPQKILDRQKFSISPTGIVTTVWEYYDGGNIAFDIRKTDSIISPYLAYLEIDVASRKNSGCGNVTSGYDSTFYGWDNEAAALGKAGNADCFKPQYSKLLGKHETPNVERIKFNFAYQSKTWVLKSVERISYLSPDGTMENASGPEIIISSALGQYFSGVEPVESKEAKEFNAKWATLLK